MKEGPFEAFERPKSREETPKEGCGQSQHVTHPALHKMTVRRTKIK